MGQYINQKAQVLHQNNRPLIKSFQKAKKKHRYFFKFFKGA